MDFATGVSVHLSAIRTGLLCSTDNDYHKGGSWEKFGSYPLKCSCFHSHKLSKLYLKHIAIAILYNVHVINTK